MPSEQVQYTCKGSRRTERGHT